MIFAFDYVNSLRPIVNHTETRTPYPTECMVKVMILRYDPYKIFIDSKTPAGLYACQKWLHEASELAWQKDYEETLKELS